MQKLPAPQGRKPRPQSDPKAPNGGPATTLVSLLAPLLALLLALLTIFGLAEILAPHTLRCAPAPHTRAELRMRYSLTTEVATFVEEALLALENERRYYVRANKIYMHVDGAEWPPRNAHTPRDWGLAKREARSYGQKAKPDGLWAAPDGSVPGAHGPRDAMDEWIDAHTAKKRQGKPVFSQAMANSKAQGYTARNAAELKELSKHVVYRDATIMGGMWDQDPVTVSRNLEAKLWDSLRF